MDHYGPKLTVIDLAFSPYAWNGFLIFLYPGESQNNPAFSLQEVLVGSSSIERTKKKFFFFQLKIQVVD